VIKGKFVYVKVTRTWLPEWTVPVTGLPAPSYMFTSYRISASCGNSLERVLWIEVAGSLVAGSPVAGDNGLAGEVGYNGDVTAAARAPERAALVRVFLVYMARPKSTIPKISSSNNGKIKAVSMRTCPLLFFIA
jgi:hypothetical protein